MDAAVKLLLALGLAVLIPALIAWAFARPLFTVWVPALMAWAYARPLFTVLIAVVFAVVYRALGVDYGLPDLFWHEDPFMQFWAGFCVALLVGLIGTLFFAAEPVITELAAANDVQSLDELLARAEKLGLTSSGVAPPAPVPTSPATPPPPATGMALSPTASGAPHHFVGSSVAQPTSLDDLKKMASKPNSTFQPPTASRAIPAPTSRQDDLKFAADLRVNESLRKLAADLDESLRLMKAGRRTDLPLRRVYASDEVIPAFVGDPPGWVRRVFGTGDATTDWPWSASSFALRMCKVLVTLLLPMLLLVPPAAVSVVDRAWAWQQGRDHGPVWGDAVLPLGALVGGVAMVAAVVVWQFLVVWKVYRVIGWFASEFLSVLLRSVGNWQPIIGGVGVAGPVVLFTLGSFVISVASHLPAAAAICILLGEIALVAEGLRWYKAWCDRYEGKLKVVGPWLGPIGLIALMTLAAVANGRDPYKLTYPHLELTPGARPVTYPPPDDRAVWGKAKARAAGLIDDRAALAAWHAAQGGGRPGGKPRLAVVAVSGGGIAAAVWTARSLKALEGKCDRFPAAVRVVTGASGGMLGAAAYVATLPQPAAGALARHDPATLDALVRGLERESLSPVARWMAGPDLLSILWPLRLTNDRGRVLEATWESNTTRTGDAADSPLAAPFRDLADGERQGWRPSLIVSPMVVEDSAPMLISNLDLGGLRPVELVEFFKLFAGEPGLDAGRLKLSTVVRMNATFPLVTPAVSLPTAPPRRVVDAGYYDNYGVSMATAWLTRNLDWLAENTGGVILIQIRAYPEAPQPGTSFEPLRWLGDGMQWLTTPLEGYTAAGRRIMIDRNMDLVEGLRGAFKARSPVVPFKTAVLECPESAALSWYLTEKDRKKLESRSELPSDFGEGTEADYREVREREEHPEEKDRTNFKREIAKVRDFLKGPRP